jgi:5-methylcytosine-specific restriction endonuclease McrA
MAGHPNFHREQRVRERRVLLEFDHVVPIGAGMQIKRGTHATLTRLRTGRESPLNLQVLCANCHVRKTTMEASCR